MILVFSVLLVTHSFAQHDPIKEKEERQKRETIQPKVVLPHYKPPKNRVLIPIKVSNPANIAGQPSPPPVLPPEPTTPTASTVPPPPPGFSNIILDLSNFEADLTDDPELHIYIDDKESPKKLRPASQTDFILEHIPVGSHSLKITHPMISDFTSKIPVAQANVPIKYPKLAVDVTQYRLIIISEPLATVCINGNCQNRADEDGYAVFYLSPKDPYNLKATKDGFQSLEEKQFYLEKPELILDLRLTKKNN
jgi:hypothetical protein